MLDKNNELQKEVLKYKDEIYTEEEVKKGYKILLKILREVLGTAAVAYGAFAIFSSFYTGILGPTLIATSLAASKTVKFLRVYRSLTPREQKYVRAALKVLGILI